MAKFLEHVLLQAVGDNKMAPHHALPGAQGPRRKNVRVAKLVMATPETNVQPINCIR